jgi:LysR family transcriptional regulator, nitrogen assimilation regulatory protein
LKDDRGSAYNTSETTIVPLTLKGLQLFIAVYEEGSISRAAERESIVQPALSAQIKSLEEGIGSTLFERSSQGVKPTQAGHHFYKLSLNIIREIRSTQQQMLDFGRHVAGSISVGLMSSICRGPFSYILERYTKLYPAVGIKILEANSAALVDKVISEELDFAICNRPANQTNLALRLLHKDMLVLVSGSRNELVPFQPYSPGTLPNLKLVLPSTINATRRLIDAEIKSGSIAPLRVIEIDGLGATMQFVARSDWSTILPSTALAGDLHSTRFIISPLNIPSLTSDIYEMHLPDRPPSLPAEKMIETIQNSLRQAERRIHGKMRP